MAPKKTNKPKTPQPMKGVKPAGLKATPKSAPPSKKKKFEEDEDDDFDEEDLEMLLAGSKKKLMAKGGMKGTPKSNGKAKGGSEDDDDDIDEEDDSDIDEEDDSDMVDEDDDMDEDDSDDDDDDDDDDDSEEDNEIQLKQTTKKVKQEAAQTPKQKPQTPKQGKQKPEVKNEKKQTPGKQVKKETVTSPAKRKVGDSESTTNFSEEDLRRKKEMDKRTLFVKNLPSNVTDKELKDLSADIKEVRIRMSYRRGTKTRGFAYLVFESEKAAEKNHKALSGKRIRDKEVMVDYVGEKSSRAKPENLPPRGELDPCKLYVTGFGVDMTEEEFEKMFPTASAVTFPMKSKTNLPLGYGFVFFSTPEEAKAVHDQMTNKQVKGKRIVVLFAKKSAHKPGQKKPRTDKKKSKDTASPVKKAKLIQKVEEEDDSEEDDDDDEDEDDDDEEDDIDDDDDDDDDDDEEDDDDDDEDDDEDDDDDDESDE